MSEKHFVCQGATVYCDKSLACNNPATAVPLTITSQTLVEMNGGKLAATDKDNSVINMNFGICNDPKFPNAKPPCMAKVIWQKVHEAVDVTESGLKLLTEKSEAICNICSVPGKIRIAFHGQVATPTVESFERLPKSIQFALCPVSRIKQERIEIKQINSLVHCVFVKEVEGQEEALPSQKVRYKVTAFNKSASEVPESIRASVSWVISVDGIIERLQSKGSQVEIDIRKDWVGKEIRVMPYLTHPSEDVSVRTVIKDTKHYVVVPEKGSIKKDFSKTLQMDYYTINNRPANEVTILRLKREVSFDSIAIRVAIQKITDDYNNLYSKGFPDDYYVTIGKLLVFMVKHENKQVKLPKFIHTSAVLELACALVDGKKGFGGGKGAPFFHIYENVVRKNDDTGIDKLLHFLYSAKYTYTGGSITANTMGFLKEFFGDEVYSWFFDDKGWDSLDMEANKQGVEFGSSLPRK